MISLDVGCGDAKHGLIGIDVRRTPQVTILSSVENLPFKQNTFDKITMIMLLEHLTNPIIALVEAKRVLAPNGLLYVEVPLHSNMVFYQLKQLLLCRFKHAYRVHCDLKMGEHKWQFTRKGLIKIFRLAGFSDLSVKIKKVLPYVDGNIVITAKKLGDMTN